MKRWTTAATALACGLAGPASAETNLWFNVFFPQTHFSWPVFRQWAEDITEATNGEVTFTFPSQSVSPPAGVLDSVRNSVADGGFVFNGFLAKNAPGTMLTQMPWMHYGDSVAISAVLWNNYEEYFAEVEKLHKVELVSMFHLGPTYLCSVTSDPITSFENLQTRRISALPGTIVDILANLDLAILASPSVQVQELASRNTIDAHIGLTLETMISFGVAPYTRSCVEMIPSIQSASFSIFFNQRTWDRLSEEHRAVIERFSGVELARRLGEATNQADSEARAQLEKMGVTFAPIDPGLQAALERSSAVISQGWEQKIEATYGIDGAALLEEVRFEVMAATPTQ